MTRSKTILLIASLLLPATAIATHAQDTKKWSYDFSLYGLGAGMSGDVAVHGFDADLNVGFDDIWKNLEFGFMSSARVGYDRWAFTTEVIYRGLGGEKGPFAAGVDQWLVEPTVSYRFCREFEALAGVRYNNLSMS